MISLLGKIQLSEVLNEALLHHVGELGAFLKFTIDYEEANFKQLENETQLKNEDLVRSYLEGIEYANNVLYFIQKQ